MKLATFTHEGRTRIGVVDADGIIDLESADPRLPASMVDLLTAGEPALDAVRAAALRTTYCGGRPRASEELDYEGELAFVIGRRCRHVPRALAHRVIGGYLIANDVSVRDWQRKAATVNLGKSCDGLDFGAR